MRVSAGLFRIVMTVLLAVLLTGEEVDTQPPPAQDEESVELAASRTTLRLRVQLELPSDLYVPASGIDCVVSSVVVRAGDSHRRLASLVVSHEPARALPARAPPVA